MEPDLSAERVQRLVEQLAAGRSVEEQLAAGEPRDLVSLAVLARQLGQTLPVAPPPAYRARLQADLQQAFVAGKPARAPRALWSRWLPRLAAATLALVIVFGSTVAASAASLPGDVLYPVKRATENVRLLLSWGPEAMVAVQLDLADARLAEIRALAAKGRAPDEALVAAVAAAHAAARAAAGQAADPALVASVEARIAQDNAALPPPESHDEQAGDGPRGASPTAVQPAVATAPPSPTATEPAATPTSPAELGLPAPTRPLPASPTAPVVAPTAAPPETSEPSHGGGAPVATEPAPVNTDVPSPVPAEPTLSPGDIRATERASYTPPPPPPTWAPPPTRRPRRGNEDPSPPPPASGPARPTRSAEPSATP